MITNCNTKPNPKGKMLPHVPNSLLMIVQNNRPTPNTCASFVPCGLEPKVAVNWPMTGMPAVPPILMPSAMSMSRNDALSPNRVKTNDKTAPSLGCTVPTAPQTIVGVNASNSYIVEPSG